MSEELKFPKGLKAEFKYTVYYHHVMPVFPEDDGWCTWNDNDLSRETAEQQAATLRDAVRTANSVTHVIDHVVLVEWTPSVRRIENFGGPV